MKLSSAILSIPFLAVVSSASILQILNPLLEPLIHKNPLDINRITDAELLLYYDELVEQCQEPQNAGKALIVYYANGAANAYYPNECFPFTDGPERAEGRFAVFCQETPTTCFVYPDLVCARRRIEIPLGPFLHHGFIVNPVNFAQLLGPSARCA